MDYTADACEAMHAGESGGLAHCPPGDGRVVRSTAIYLTGFTGFELWKNIRFNAPGRFAPSRSSWPLIALSASSGRSEER